jgi:fructose-1,6-bisphosphatase/inositol monophosphatase family enzyme
MDLAKATEDIRAFLLEAGAHALKIQKGVDRQYKQGEQAVTQADLDISKMAAERLSYWLSQDEHVLIDEESIDQISNPEEVFATTKYQWVLDPVDGTAGYALGRDRWGVSLGLLKYGVPIGGGFYMPAIGALILVEGEQAYFTDIRTGEKYPMPQAKAMEVNSQIFIESFFGFEHCWSKDMTWSKAWLNTPESALQAGYSTLMLQSAGMTFFELFSIWDLVGIASVGRATGHKIMSLQEGLEWQRFTAKDFKDNWKLKGKWIMTHPDNYDAIKEALLSK